MATLDEVLRGSTVLNDSQCNYPLMKTSSWSQTAECTSTCTVWPVNNLCKNIFLPRFFSLFLAILAASKSDIKPILGARFAAMSLLHHHANKIWSMHSLSHAYIGLLWGIGFSTREQPQQLPRHSNSKTLHGSSPSEELDVVGFAVYPLKASCNWARRKLFFVGTPDNDISMYFE